MSDHSSTILTSLSDELTASNLAGPAEFWFSFGVGSLFFDSLPISAASLLSNPRLREVWLKSHEAASAVYSSGLLRPIIMGDAKSLTDVAEQMIKRRTIHHLGSDEELRFHAESIDRSNVHEMWIDEGLFRRDYACTYQKALSRAMSQRALGRDYAITRVVGHGQTGGRVFDLLERRGAKGSAEQLLSRRAVSTDAVVVPGVLLTRHQRERAMHPGDVRLLVVVIARSIGEVCDAVAHGDLS